MRMSDVSTRGCNGEGKVRVLSGGLKRDGLGGADRIILGIHSEVRDRDAQHLAESHDGGNVTGAAFFASTMVCFATAGTHGRTEPHKSMRNKDENKNPLLLHG